MVTTTVQRSATINVNPVFNCYEVSYLENGVVVDKKGNIGDRDKAITVCEKWAGKNWSKK